MEGPRLVIRLQERGLHLWLKDGKPVVTESAHAKLTPADIAQLKQYRDEVIAYLENPKLYAIVERAYADPPDFGEGRAAYRDSVIVEAEGFPVMALPPEYVEFVLAWNRQSIERMKKKNKESSKKAKVDTQRRIDAKEHQ